MGMLNKQYTKNYLETIVFTSSPEKLTLLLYTNLVKLIMQAQLAIQEKDLEKVHNCIVKAKKIILNFKNTLNKKYEISQSMLVMYDYMYRRLTEANIKKDRDILEEILGYAREMRDTWSQAMIIVNDSLKAADSRNL
ncbi:MAG TPA: flagellar export chaperone FliS [Desulfitobacteriaceae bacterium]|nr:flagellar export chaperone FliS [Desulfitobacteriaceae bacterium]